MSAEVATAPLTEDGRPMRKCDGGWYDPECGDCSRGLAGYGSEQESCHCFLSNEDYTALAKDSDFCPRREEA